MSELNRHVLLSQPALSRLVDRLAERGLVERCADPADGRGVRLSLTDAGRVVQRRIGRRHARGVARAMTAGLTAAELAQLETICLKLAAAPMAASDKSEVLIPMNAPDEVPNDSGSSWSAPAPATPRRRGCWPTARPNAPPPWPPGTGTR